MANILKIKLVHDAGKDSASSKQLGYIEGLCGDEYRNEFLEFMGKRNSKEACKHITVQMGSLWIKSLRNHLKWKFEHVTNNNNND